jgi:threonine synthase
VALAVLEKLVDRGDIKKKDRVVVISTANGLKFTDFLFNYHKDQIKGVQSDFAFSPMESAANYEDVKKVISDRIEV